MRPAVLLSLVALAACAAPEPAAAPVDAFTESPVAFSAADTILTLGGTTFGPPTVQLDPIAKVGTARFRGVDAPRVELVLNYFAQGVWTDTAFTVQGVAELIRASIPADSMSSYLQVDSVTADSSFYVRRFLGTAVDGSPVVALTRVWDVGGDAAAATVTRAIDGTVLEREKWMADSLVLWSRQLARLRADTSWRSRFGTPN